ncbi:HipA family kinase [Variovorax paradoxus]|uniref:HipA family kinase n=1 Tax=Variovorax paradoxus TaxID=34073 RepID=UPI002864AA7A|nr:HipA family kinase [Variovorax paradoxus]MDR6453922.1 hypothetical protein [Variovorax paradoxus]
MGNDQAAGTALPAEKEIAPRSANDSAFDLLPKPVKVLALNKGAEQVRRNREESKGDELWLATAYDEEDPSTDDVSIYLRIANPMPVVAELLCAVLGRSLGLPVPEPYLVKIDAGALPSSRLLTIDRPALAFASRDVGGTSFSQLLRSGSPGAQAMLMKWEHLIPVATFDEWMANRDRNLSNIIFMSNVLWIIDHAEAFHGSARGLFGLPELVGESASNILADMLVKLNAAACAAHLESAQTWLTSMAARVSIPDAAACADIEQWQTPEQQAELIDFIAQRLSLTHALLCNRLGHPQLST